MRVLAACEFSGIVRDAFSARGHDAWSCDLLPTESEQTKREGKHIQGDVLGILGNGWDLMIAHPPCTYLSNAAARFLYPKGVLDSERLKLGLAGREFFLALYNAPVDKICVENPVPSKIIGLPPYGQIINPYLFGEKVSKRTCLWLKNLPPLFQKYSDSRARQSTKIAGNWFNKGGKERQKNRAKFWPSIAKAMAEQWG